MASLNKVMLIGNLTRDPEVKQTTGGTVLGNLRLAVSRKYKNKAGELVDDVCYVDVTAWGRDAENCRDYLHKGSPVFIEGRLRYEEWEKDGQKRNKLTVVAERIQFLGAPKGGGRAPQGDAPDAEPVAEAPHAHVEAPQVHEESPRDRAGADDDNLPF